jgi:hypothetical protein
VMKGTSFVFCFLDLLLFRLAPYSQLSSDGDPATQHMRVLQAVFKQRMKDAFFVGKEQGIKESIKNLHT